ncbi:hypothetical protein [Nannocystis pusilla]|uniref:Uncharacterized protein n=1 Tax=Nannocystis pusilla TaxID=889268 RepID=A0ABS7TPU2_9BACT|nr:hypothetical protein [Nannocystis pusilla]MBZ5710240.1 hypothetical protein [Nannocystis pusilla]
MIRRSAPLLLGTWFLVAMAPACGPASPPADTTASEGTGASSSGTTTATPTSGGPATEPPSETEATASGESTATEPVVTGSTSPGSTSTGPGSTSTGPGSTSTTSTGAETTTSSTTGESSSSTGDGPGPASCPPVDCQPIFFEDENHDLTDIESGWLFCNEGTVHYREEAIDCAHEVFWPKCEGQGGECATDGDCSGNETCANIYGDCYCTAQCMSDSDCGDGQICLCAGDLPAVGADLALKNQCVPADCTANADCAGECGCRGDKFFCGTLEGAFCPTPDDECEDDEDCEDGGYCGWDSDQKRWVCQGWGICE